MSPDAFNSISDKFPGILSFFIKEVSSRSATSHCNFCKLDKISFILSGLLIHRELTLWPIIHRVLFGFSLAILLRSYGASSDIMFFSHMLLHLSSMLLWCKYVLSLLISFLSFTVSHCETFFLLIRPVLCIFVNEFIALHQQL